MYLLGVDTAGSRNVFMASEEWNNFEFIENHNSPHLLLRGKHLTQNTRDSTQIAGSFTCSMQANLPAFWR